MSQQTFSRLVKVENKFKLIDIISEIYPDLKINKNGSNINLSENFSEWYNTININEIINHYENTNKNFLFLGSVEIDFNETKQEIYNIDLDKSKRDGFTKFGIISNLDDYRKAGSNWISIYIDMNKGYTYYFDSYGNYPEKYILTLLNKFLKYFENSNLEQKFDIYYFNHLKQIIKVHIYL